MKTLRAQFISLLASLAISAGLLAATTVPTDVQQPGTQPGQVSNLESPDKCDNCHGGYNASVEPAHNWRGSMMAHAGRDPIFWATLAIAEQDFDGAGDLCIRCHSTGGWLAGRSTPTDGSGLTIADADGVECDFCHKMTNPDHSDPFLRGVMISPFIANELNPADPDGIEGYYGSGMASIWAGSEKLGPYNDAAARHQFAQSRFHRSVDFCGSCHDVSNPVVGNLAHNNGTQPGAGAVIDDDTPGGPVNNKAAFKNPPYKYGVVERTFSEYKAGMISQTPVSAYPTLPADLKGGALKAIYEAATATGGNGDYADGTVRYYSCQSCHMRPVTGTGCNKTGAPLRTDLPLHDMTGGNYWMPVAIEYLNAKGQLRLGGGMTAGQISAMRDGALRAKQQLNLAASLSVSGNVVKVVNHTGHKLISGYPEGRRMWLNIKWYDSLNNKLREDGAYGPLVDELGQPVTVANPAGGPPVQVQSILNLDDPNMRIYEAHYGMTQEWAAQLSSLGVPDSLVLSFDRYTGAVHDTLGHLRQAAPGSYEETFHFVLNNTVIKDNRVPPYGMQYDVAKVRNALPVPANQYGGGTAGSTYNYWDAVTLNPPVGAMYATIDLLYQPTSWEYVQFLYLANKGTDPAQGGNAFLGNEGVYMLDAWLNNGMAAPHVMASTTWGSAPQASCQIPAAVPAQLTTTAGDKQVAVSWQAVTAPAASGYRLYYDQAGKAQLLVDQTTTSHTDTNLTNGQKYCYKVTSYYLDTGAVVCESAFSTISCATPTAPGQAVAGVASPLETGRWVKSGKGSTATTVFEVVVYPQAFTAGDAVIIRGKVTDKDGAPLSSATVTMQIRTQNGTVVTTLTGSAPTDALGRFEIAWQTRTPDRKGQGGTAPGDYSAVTTGVTLNGYTWNAVATSVMVKVQ